MEEIHNFLEPIQILMENVKNDILSKSDNIEDKLRNKSILNALFNLMDYQMILMNQIFLFSQNNQNNNDNRNNLDNLLRINKDILVSMINKFLSSINSIFKNSLDKEGSIYNINKRTQSNSKFGKILNIQTSTNEKNKNFMLNNSFAQYNSPIKKNMEKEFNTTITMTQQSSTKKILSFFYQDKNSYKFLKNKNIKYSKKNKINKNIFDKLYSNKDERCDHEEKKKHKMLVYQSYSNSMKNLFVNLNDNYIKQLKK